MHAWLPLGATLVFPPPGVGHVHAVDRMGSLGAPPGLGSGDCMSMSLSAVLFAYVLCLVLFPASVGIVEFFDVPVNNFINLCAGV